MSPRVGIVGADNLLGKELAELLAAAPNPPWGAAPLRLIAAAPRAPAAGSSSHRLAALGKEPVLLDPLEETALADLDLVFFAVSDSLAAFAPTAVARGALVVDAAAAAGAPAVPGALRVPHPVARALASVLAAVSPLGVVSATAVVAEPASERGLAGLGELQSQSVQLLALAALPMEVFGAQIAYNLRAELPAEVRPSLVEIQAAIAADLRALAIAPSGAARFPLPALRLWQAPLFHGYVVAIALRFAAAWNPEALARALRTAPLRYLGDPAEQPDVLSVAGESEIQIGAAVADPLAAGTAWLQIAFDNLRLRAATALRLAAAAWEQRHVRA